MKLEIVIPTFNRFNHLLKRLDEIYCQGLSDVSITVIDNCSDNYDILKVKSELEIKYEGIRIIRNKTNVGLAGNIVKALEYASYEWVWILGDDDSISDKSIKVIRSLCVENSECVYINLNCKGLVKSRSIAFKTSGICNLIDSVDSFYNLLFISAGIYKVDAYKPFLKFGYMYSYTMAPHLAVLLMSIGASGVCLFSNEALVESNNVSSDVNERWSDITLQLGLVALLELPLEFDSNRFKKFASLVETHLQSPLYNFKVLIWHTEFRQKAVQLTFIYQQLFSRSFHLKRRIKYVLQYQCLKFLVRSEYMLCLVRRIYFAVGKSQKRLSRFTRI